MELLLQRDASANDCTIGNMFIDGVFECYTLEDVVRPYGEKVYGKTAIPAGQYHVIVNMSNRFKTLMPLLLNVPGFEGVRIHPGNTSADTEGCILVGQNRTDKSIGGSRAAYAQLLPKIQAALAAGDTVFITIEDAP
jgi:hypothetical protein